MEEPRQGCRRRCAEGIQATPLPIRAEELGSIPNAVSPIPGERTGEIDVNELETYDEAD